MTATPITSVRGKQMPEETIQRESARTGKYEGKELPPYW